MLSSPSAVKAPSEFANYDLVPVTMSRQDKSQKAEFLLSKDGKTLIRFTKLDLTKDPYAETMNQISLTDRPVRGNPDAKVTIVNFDDFECPFCARMHSTLMTEILPQYKDKIKIVYKDYPLLQIHPWAQHAANDANCLAKENSAAYWELADYLHLISVPSMPRNKICRLRLPRSIGRPWISARRMGSTYPGCRHVSRRSRMWS
jgi:protein-disulfide isomerase